MVEAALLPHLLQFEHSINFGSSEALKQAAAAGLGLTCLSELAVRDLVGQGRLAVIDSELPPMSRPLYIVRHRSRTVPIGLAEFIAGPSAPG